MGLAAGAIGCCLLLINWFHGTVIGNTANLISGAAFAAWFVYLLVRAPFLGVWVRGNTLLIRSWYLTRTVLIHPDTVIACEGYSGILNMFDPFDRSRFLWAITITQAGQHISRQYRGTVGFRSSIEKQIATMRETLGVESPSRAL